MNLCVLLSECLTKKGPSLDHTPSLYIFKNSSHFFILRQSLTTCLILAGVEFSLLALTL